MNVYKEGNILYHIFYGPIVVRNDKPNNVSRTGKVAIFQFEILVSEYSKGYYCYEDDLINKRVRLANDADIERSLNETMSWYDLREGITNPNCVRIDEESESITFVGEEGIITIEKDEIKVLKGLLDRINVCS